MKSDNRAVRKIRGALLTGDSYWPVFLISILIGSVSVLASLALDFAAHGNMRSLYASDYAEGAAVILFTGVALLRVQMRKREMQHRMQIVEDVNHHVRNALTAITLRTSLQDDPELDALVRDASDRVDWVLNEVLSRTVAPRPYQPHSSWQPGRQLGEQEREPAQRG